MIKTFEVENFRLFDQIKINRISNVNLIVGKNNAGKSALLEALLLYVSRVSPDVIMKLLSSRQEQWSPSSESYSMRLATTPVRHLFKNHKLPLITESGFRLSSQNDVDSIHVKTADYIQEEIDQRIIRRRLMPSELEHFDYDAKEYEIWLVCDYGENTLRVFPLQDNFFGDIRRKMMFRETKSNTSSYQFIPTIGIDDYTAASLWDSISLTDLESEVIKGLKLLDQSVSAIAFVANELRKDSPRIPLVKMENVKEPVPLKSLGDGMTHVLQIILALVNSKNGTLVIDEFENGLHWSIHENVWRMVFELSDRLNVQVFASTHSRDCINGFEKAWNSNKDKGAFLRVYKENGVVSLKEYDLELLSNSIETEVEVR